MNVKIRNKFIEIKYSVSNGLISEAPSNFLLTVPRRHFCCGSYLFIIIFIVLRIA